MLCYIMFVSYFAIVLSKKLNNEELNSRESITLPV